MQPNWSSRSGAWPGGMEGEQGRSVTLLIRCLSLRWLVLGMFTRKWLWGTFGDDVGGCELGKVSF